LLATHKDKIFVPDRTPLPRALSRTTHLGIGAHSDDLEFMAFEGIIKCHQKPGLWFGGVICTDGAGSARGGEFEKISNDELRRIRAKEQQRAAALGKYSFVAQLGHASSELQKPQGTKLAEELTEIIHACRPQVIYTHNPADKHPTHVRVLVAVMTALHRLPERMRPRKLIGCEVWRDLDWLQDDKKVLMDVSGHEKLAKKLNACFASQIQGGKRYDLAVMGRRRANATFYQPRETDAVSEAIFGMDLTPLIGSPPDRLLDYTLKLIDHFKNEVARTLKKSLD
jgi:LmbE family N-acetylglucosaminyl deacetylase